MKCHEYNIPNQVQSTNTCRTDELLFKLPTYLQNYKLDYSCNRSAPKFQVTEIISTLASGTGYSIYFTGKFQSVLHLQPFQKAANITRHCERN